MTSATKQTNNSASCYPMFPCLLWSAVLAVALLPLDHAASMDRPKTLRPRLHLHPVLFPCSWIMAEEVISAAQSFAFLKSGDAGKGVEEAVDAVADAACKSLAVEEVQFVAGGDVTVPAVNGCCHVWEQEQCCNTLRCSR